MLRSPGGLDVERAALEGTGPFAAIRQGMNNILGPFLSGEPFPLTSASRNTLMNFERDVTPALILNGKFPVSEQEWIRRMTPSPTRFMTDPDGEVTKLVELNRFLSDRRSRNQSMLGSGRQMTMETRGNLIDQNLYIDLALDAMGPISHVSPLLQARETPAQGGRTGRGQGARRTPQPGAVEDGYEFLGGNPADPQSWRKVR